MNTGLPKSMTRPVQSHDPSTQVYRRAWQDRSSPMIHQHSSAVREVYWGGNKNTVPCWKSTLRAWRERVMDAERTRMKKMAWQLNEEVNRDKTGKAHEINVTSITVVCKKPKSSLDSLFKTKPSKNLTSVQVDFRQKFCVIYNSN